MYEKSETVKTSKDTLMHMIKAALFLFCLLPCTARVEEMPTGTLVVSYRMEAHPERLARVRVVLTDEHFHSQMYPKGNAYAEDKETNTYVIAIENLKPGDYILEFVVPDSDGFFEEPEKKDVIISSGKIAKIHQEITVKKDALSAAFLEKAETEISHFLPEKEFSLQISTVEVPEGKAIIGNPFSKNPQDFKEITLPLFYIGKYEVTNEEYAAWLNDRFKNQTIIYKNGIVHDIAGNLICKTLDGDPASQIAFSNATFSSVKQKERHPVILVSWHGADSFCRDLGYRLPTEAEWEKAAGMSFSSPQKRFRYGFSKDTIDERFANYKSFASPLKTVTVNTTPVGYYNGVNETPLKPGETKVLTHHATSPAGAFDMSGNVWEWTADWDRENHIRYLSSDHSEGPSSGTKKVAKGGCYDSLAEGVAVSERLLLPPEHVDIFTGFRVAK